MTTVLHRALAVLFSLVIGIVLAGANLAAQTTSQEAPFGLLWGASADQIRALGVELEEAPGKDFGTSYWATKLPKVISDMQGVFMSFGYDNKLWRIAALSTSFRDDPSGVSVRSRYNELAAVLADKYGKGRQSHYQDSELWKASTEFVMGIKVGRSHWYTNFDSTDVFVQLGVLADDSSTTQWRIITENKALRAKFDAGKKTHERSAL
jgi:hypothetical protein